MSATNRGAKRVESDFYATPIECVNSLIDALPELLYADFILEPSAGNGNILKAIKAKNPDGACHIEAIELREEERENLEELADMVTIGDFLKVNTEYRYYDLIIGNPPYSLAQEFIDKALELLDYEGRLILLLRLNFFGSKKRFEWWQNKIPSRVYVLSNRPSFTGKGTDATEYAWFIWEKNDRPIEKTEFKVIWGR